MKKLLVICIALSVAGISCDKDDDPEKTASIVGTWQGDRSEVSAKYGIIPIYEREDEDFNVTVEFKEDGTISFQDENGQITTGTYSVSGNQLTTDVEFEEGLDINTATFDIVELSATKLRLELETEQEVTIPEYGSITADIEGNFAFDRD